jgi:hypothetical protein
VELISVIPAALPGPARSEMKRLDSGAARNDVVVVVLGFVFEPIVSRPSSACSGYGGDAETCIPI